MRVTFTLVIPSLEFAHHVKVQQALVHLISSQRCHDTDIRVFSPQYRCQLPAWVNPFPQDQALMSSEGLGASPCQELGPTTTSDVRSATKVTQDSRR
jgi:hypothetical protein